MADNKRYVRPNAPAVTRYRKAKGLTMSDLAALTQRATEAVSIDTVKRAENEKTERMRTDSIKIIAKALEVAPEKLMILPPLEPTPSSSVAAEPSKSADGYRYTWEDLCRGARKVAAKLYDSGQLNVDAVLTFPGPSSIFCGLVLAMLPPEVFIAIPVYTAIFVDRGAKISVEQHKHFHLVQSRFFTMLVPKDLVADKKRIIVIDDVIISGGFIKKMRTVFKKQEVKFACCICYDARTLLTETETKPGIIGLEDHVEQRKCFPMPWGSDSFSFEDVFHLRSEMSKRSADHMTRIEHGFLDKS